MLVEIQMEEVIQRVRMQPRRYWGRLWLAADRSLQFGHNDILLRELKMEDNTSFFNLLRMQPEMFDKLLLHRTGPRIHKKDTDWRKAQ